MMIEVLLFFIHFYYNLDENWIELGKFLEINVKENKKKE